MSLAADIASRLDAGALVDGLISGLGERASALGTIEVPDTTGETGSISSTAGSFDAASLAPLVGRIIEQAGGGLAALGPQGNVLGAITGALELVEQLTAGDLRSDVEALVQRLTQELEGSREGGVFGVLLRLSQLLAASREGGAISGLLQTLLGATGVTPPPAVRDIGGLVPALDSLVRSIGGLMMLESVLSESQRLTGIMAQRLDADAVQRQVDQVLRLADPALVDRIASTDPGDLPALERLAETLAVLADRIGLLQQELAAGMGLGEATLAYLDVQAVQDEVAAAAALLRGVDLDALDRMLRSSLGGLAHFMALDFSRAPAQSLDGLLDQAESQVAALAAQLSAWNPADLVEPLQQGIDTVTAPLADLTRVIGEVVVTIRSALESIKRVIVELPVGQLVDAITTLTEPITQVLKLIAGLVGDIGEALATAAGAAEGALGEVEGVVDDFQDQVQALFADARTFIEGLNLDSVVGSLSERISAFTQALSQAQLKPYFDTAADAIDGAADVVGAVPFDLLPESMKADVDALAQPIKAVDLVAFETRIESMVGIGPDGSFTPRADLEAAVAGIQQKFDALVQTLRDHDPEQYLERIDQELASLAERIQEIVPSVTLQPVQDAIDQIKAAVAGFDLEAQLQPLQQVFDQAIAAMQAYSPAQLIEPLEARLTEVRQKVIDTLKLDEWSPALDVVHERAGAALDLIDPAQLESKLSDLLTQARGLVAVMPDANPQWLGTVVAALHRGSSARIYPEAFLLVQQWIDERSGAAALTARSSAIAEAVARTRAAVAAIDVAGLSGELEARLVPIGTALTGLASSLPADSAPRAALERVSLRLDIRPGFGQLAANRTRYLESLDAALPLGETLRRTGLSEVDLTIDKLHRCFEPVSVLLGALRGFVRATGLNAVDAGVPQMLRALFEVAPPARLAAMTSPIFIALRERVLALIDDVIDPVKDAIARLQGLIDAIDLAPLKQAVDEVFQETVAEVQALSPAVLLAEPIAGVNAVKAEVAAFDPLGPIVDVLDTLRDTVARVLGKLDATELLADPVAIYREIVDALDALNLEALMAPVLDLLDQIANDVDAGLDDTVTAFQRLQDALPAGGGGSSASASVAA